MIRNIILCFVLAGFSIQCSSQNDPKLPDDRGYIVKTGQMAPDFTINFTNGNPAKKLSAYRGKIVMLQFTASWCKVCIQEMPHIESRIWQPLKDKGLVLFGVDRKEKPEKVIKFAGKMKISYPLILDENGSIFEKYADPKAGVTRNVVIDREGKIVFLTRLFDENEFNEMVKKIEELLKE